MAELKTITISDIYVGNRLRDVDEDHAQAIAVSVREIGLQSPIQVRSTPAQKGGKFTLVSGGHRLRACMIAGLAEIEAFVVKADAREAQMLEIAENLFRNDLSVIDRAVFVERYRELYEEQHGKVGRGGDRKSKGQVGALIDGGFAAHVADRLGVSERTAKRLQELARRLSPELRVVLRHSPLADNQSALLKLSKMEPAMQRRAAVGWRETGDIRKVLALLSDRPDAPVRTADDQQFERLVDAWSRATAEAQRRFLAHVGIADAVAVAAE